MRALCLAYRPKRLGRFALGLSAGDANIAQHSIVKLGKSPALMRSLQPRPDGAGPSVQPAASELAVAEAASVGRKRHRRKSAGAYSS